jgi:hypothetical protein
MVRLRAMKAIPAYAVEWIAVIGLAVFLVLVPERLGGARWCGRALEQADVGHCSVHG